MTNSLLVVLRKVGSTKHLPPDFAQWEQGAGKLSCTSHFTFICRQDTQGAPSCHGFDAEEHACIMLHGSYFRVVGVIGNIKVRRNPSEDWS